MDRPVKSRRRRIAQGAAVGALLFLALLAILLFAGDLSSSKFIYVDF
jgi:hypothetical protein